MPPASAQGCAAYGACHRRARHCTTTIFSPLDAPVLLLYFHCTVSPACPQTIIPPAAGLLLPSVAVLSCSCASPPAYCLPDPISSGRTLGVPLPSKSIQHGAKECRGMAAARPQAMGALGGAAAAAKARCPHGGSILRPRPDLGDHRARLAAAESRASSSRPSKQQVARSSGSPWSISGRSADRPSVLAAMADVPGVPVSATA